MRQEKKVTHPGELGLRLGKAISKRRKERQLTQDELAGVVEVDAETISRFERGTTLPSLQRLLVIADALDAGVGDLLSEASALPDDRGRQLISQLKALGARDQQLLVDFADLLRRRQTAM